ncbi:MAG: hypothetical protein K2Q15_13275 [Burkholderiales bacterium]|nr:hypothetical protein [Burkholderiales bacterium]
MNTYKKIIFLSGSLLVAASSLTSAADRGILQFYGMITTPTCQVNSSAATPSTPATLSCLINTPYTQGMASVSENTKQNDNSSAAYRTEYLLAAVTHKNFAQTSLQKIVTVTYR